MNEKNEMNTQNPKESFNIREAKGDDFYKIMIVNEALKDYKNKGQFPWFLLITIDMVDTTEKYGLPTNEEAKILDSVENNFSLLINGVASYQYIGRITSDGTRAIYYYVDEPHEIYNELNNLIEKNTYKREFQYDIMEDPTWESVSFFFDY